MISTTEDGVYFLLNDEMSAVKKLSRFDTVFVPTGFKKISIVYKDSPTIVRLSEWILSRVKYEDGVYSCEIKVLKSLEIPRNNLYYLLESGGKNVHIDVGENELALFEGEEFGPGTHYLNLPPAKYELKTRNFATGFSKKYKIKISEGPHQVYIPVSSDPSKSKYTAFSMFPGFSQIYVKQYLKGGILLAGFVGLVTSSLHTSNEYSRSLENYNSSREIYRLSTDYARATELGAQMQAYYDHSRQHRLNLALSLSALIGMYGLHLFDANRTHKKLQFYVAPSDKISAGAIVRF